MHWCRSSATKPWRGLPYRLLNAFLVVRQHADTVTTAQVVAETADAASWVRLVFFTALDIHLCVALCKLRWRCFLRFAAAMQGCRQAMACSAVPVSMLPYLEH